MVERGDDGLYLLVLSVICDDLYESFSFISGAHEVKKIMKFPKMYTYYIFPKVVYNIFCSPEDVNRKLIPLLDLSDENDVLSQMRI